MVKRIYISALLLTALPSFRCLWAVQKPTTLTESCVTRECHDSYRQKKYVHEPVAKGVCKFCHKLVDPKVHSFKLFRTRQELCGSCHLAPASDAKMASGAQLKPKAQIGKGKYLHKPIEEGKCLDCHNPHSSNYQFLRKAATVGELCVKCHEKQEIAKNLHKPFAEGKCNLCHDNHSSNYGFLLITNQRQLCFSCHEDTKSELDRFKYVHKPAVDRGCTACHAPHGSDYFRLLVKEYTPDFYASFDIANYDLCFSCHRADKVLVKETENVTDFRNGTENLHYIHVNTPVKGRTCRTCHATHASNEPRHLRKAVPYGGWEVPIQFEKTETGGACSPGCHNPRAYDRAKPVVYNFDKKI
jgi:predicted CXXCH cytochrome family protein